MNNDKNNSFKDKNIIIIVIMFELIFIFKNIIIDPFYESGVLKAFNELVEESKTNKWTIYIFTIKIIIFYQQKVFS